MEAGVRALLAHFEELGLGLYLAHLDQRVQLAAYLAGEQGGEMGAGRGVQSCRSSARAVVGAHRPAGLVGF